MSLPEPQWIWWNPGILFNSLCPSPAWWNVLGPLSIARDLPEPGIPLIGSWALWPLSLEPYCWIMLPNSQNTQHRYVENQTFGSGLGATYLSGTRLASPDPSLWSHFWLFFFLPAQSPHLTITLILHVLHQESSMPYIWTHLNCKYNLPICWMNLVEYNPRITLLWPHRHCSSNQFCWEPLFYC